MDATEIRAVNSMLHLVFHRNKNQHQRAKWWKWLSVLKRTTLDLAQSLDGARLNAVESHRQHLATHLIPRCYLAFSTVVADNQFSALGIVLMATLARLVKAAGINLGRPTATRMKKNLQKSTSITPVEDLGERIRRGGDNQGQAKGRAPCDSKIDGQGDSAESTDGPTRKTKTKTKTKKRKNAIDDLFSSLL
ncbi:hypothetical protein N7510_005585 [Penicillium lagena]|uniref:uncharacterized protein n=1 Tax=Penicillium lagena TaxID=94218 RepID=UPI00253FAC5A|nr:uncharacterized protein N7510_005585 [Penicillium lagena]KAJ5612391.1 hypothetical protein N7510_005585 [Penicillium lagena]